MAQEAQKTKGLVPDNFEDFRSLQFWDGFFDTRGDKPFEWYGDWRQLQSFLKPLCTPQTEVLMAGCGNSELSAELYDSGCEQITNVDFSRKLIASMMAKNLRSRPKMKWKVGDITALKMESASFDVVLDKGGLDALMGEDSEEGSQTGGAFLEEAARVLRPGGCYICITLAQPHVLRLLLDSCRGGWKVKFASIPPAPDMARSALQPVFVVATKGSDDKCWLESTIRPSPRAPNAEQLADICQIIEAEQGANGKNRHVIGTLARNGTGFDFDNLHPGRSVRLGLPIATLEPGTARFSATVIDTEGKIADSAARLSCIFLVPQGREDEWLFASDEGRRQVAAQCSSRRVVFVALNRGHVFGDLAAVQGELSPLVRPLAPAAARFTARAIPILTTAEGVGRRRELESVESSISGRIIAEDVVLNEDGHSNAVRRLIFAAARNLVQSEAVLRGGPDACQPADGPPGKPATKENRKKKKGKAPLKTAEIDLDAAMQLDHSVLSMQYHNLIVAGICSGGCSLEGCSKSEQQKRALIVGLGGGGLAIFLHRYLEMDVRVAELDPAVLEVASKHFGFAKAVGLEADVADGLAAVEQAATESTDSIDVLIVDAGSSDASLSMSCPPPAFLERKFLQDAAKALKPCGMLVVNCVTRLHSARELAVIALQVVFPNVYMAEVEGDINCVLFATGMNLNEAAFGPKGALKVLRSALKGGQKQAESVAEHFEGLRLCKRTS